MESSGTRSFTVLILLSVVAIGVLFNVLQKVKDSKIKPQFVCEETKPIYERNSLTSFKPTKLYADLIDVLPATTLNTSKDTTKTVEDTVTIWNLFGKRKTGKKYLLIYNNVAKCGSRSLAHSIKDLFKYRRMNDVEVDKSYKKETTVLREALESVKTPAYISGHMPFIELERQDVVYINMVRDPLDRFISLFYFARNGDKNGVKPSRQTELKNETIDDYVRRGGSIDTSNIFYHFMESNPQYRNMSSEDALQLCKRNIDRYYTLVGLTEEMSITMKLLEKLLPDFLPGLHRVFRNKNKERKEGYSTLNKTPPSRETVKILKETLRFEYELYCFVRERFNRLKKRYHLQRN